LVSKLIAVFNDLMEDGRTILSEEELKKILEIKGKIKAECLSEPVVLYFWGSGLRE